MASTTIMTTDLMRQLTTFFNRITVMTITIKKKNKKLFDSIIF